jgi:hypothetical protein
VLLGYKLTLTELTLIELAAIRLLRADQIEYLNLQKMLKLIFSLTMLKFLKQLR